MKNILIIIINFFPLLHSIESLTQLSLVFFKHYLIFIFFIIFYIYFIINFFYILKFI